MRDGVVNALPCKKEAGHHPNYHDHFWWVYTHSFNKILKQGWHCAGFWGQNNSRDLRPCPRWAHRQLLFHVTFAMLGESSSGKETSPGERVVQEHVMQELVRWGKERRVFQVEGTACAKTCNHESMKGFQELCWIGMFGIKGAGVGSEGWRNDGLESDHVWSPGPG